MSAGLEGLGKSGGLQAVAAVITLHIMNSRIVSIGVVQHASQHEKGLNVAHACAGIREAAARGASLVILPELFASDYFCQTEDPTSFDLAEPLDGPTVSAISELARELKVEVVAPIFEKRARGLYHNSLVVVGKDGSALGIYRKMHIPEDPQFCEKFYFTPGDLGFCPIETSAGNLGTLICWDQWFPEAARAMALAGAEILIYPTAIGWMPSEKEALGAAQLDAWRTIQRAHAIANGTFVVAANRVGTERSGASELEFWGHSFICDPSGRIIAEAGEGEEVLVAACDLHAIEEQRRWWPFFRDRRIDAYDGLGERWLGSPKGRSFD